MSPCNDDSPQRHPSATPGTSTPWNVDSLERRPSATTTPCNDDPLQRGPPATTTPCNDRTNVMNFNWARRELAKFPPGPIAYDDSMYVRLVRHARTVFKEFSRLLDRMCMVQRS